MLGLICGEYKTGKSLSAATFVDWADAKGNQLYLDWDDGFKSVTNFRDQTGKPWLSSDSLARITVEKFFNNAVYDLMFQTEGTGSKIAPPFTMEAPTQLTKYNNIIRSLDKTGEWEGKSYKGMVVDSLTNMFRVWDEMIMRMNSVSHLRIQDYGTLESILFSQFIPGLKSLLAKKRLEYIILIDHIELEKDNTTGMLLEYPVGPSRNQGRMLGMQFDEIWKQQQEGSDYVWRTRKTGLFQAGSRLNLPEVIKPATYQQLATILKQRGVAL